MTRIVRWVLSGFGVLVALVLVLPFVLPSGIFKQQIVEATQRATGRALAIDGELSISFWPTLGVVANKVRFANAAGSAAPDMLTMESLIVGAELFPLLSGRLNVTEVKFINPVINLEVDQQGVGNWVFQPQTSPNAAKPTTAPSVDGQFSFQDVEVTGGVLSYRNAQSGFNQKVEAVEAVIKLPSLDEAMSLQGGLTWNGQAMTLSVEAAEPRALMTNGKSRLAVKMASPAVTVSFDGDAGADGVDGEIAAQGISARQLAAWVGASVPAGQGFAAFSLSGAVAAKAGVFAFKTAKLSLDGMNGNGEFTFDTRKVTPHLKGQFTVDRLDLNAYQSAGPAAGNGVAAWSEAPLDLAPLKLINADLILAASSLSAGKLKIGECELLVAVSAGRLRANLRQLELYGGTGKGVITLDEAASVPRLGLEFSVDGVQGEPFLTDATGFQKLTGLGSVSVRVLTSGRSQSAWMQKLGGSTQFRFTDGTIKGVNLAEIARTISSVLTGSAVGTSASTDFSEFSGTFVIKDGIAANKDLKLAGPFVRMNGTGLIDVGRQQMDYRVMPKAVASAQGQGGSDTVARIGIPFRISGPWSMLSYQPDLTNTATTAIDAILKGKNPLDSFKGNGGLEGLFPATPAPAKPAGGASQEQPAPANAPEKPDPANTLKDIFGGGN